jgi:hypothetical protein
MECTYFPKSENIISGYSLEKLDHQRVATRRRMEGVYFYLLMEETACCLFTIA